MSGQQVQVPSKALAVVLALFPTPIRSDRLGDYRPEIAQAVQTLRAALEAPQPSPSASAGEAAKLLRVIEHDLAPENDHPTRRIGGPPYALLRQAAALIRALTAIPDSGLSGMAGIPDKSAIPDKLIPEPEQKNSRDLWLDALENPPPRTPADVTNAELKRLTFGVDDLQRAAAKDRADQRAHAGASTPQEPT